MAAKREAWSEFISKTDPKHLVFLDESGININMTRRYGWGLGGERVVDHTPFSTPQSTTVLSSIRLDGTIAATTFQGGTTGEKFLTYLREVLLPTLHIGDIVVMDNLRTHHIREVGNLLGSVGAEAMYLPPYSPDLNPIEKLWSKAKTILRSWKVRSLDKLPDSVTKVLALVSPSDCQSWFTCTGY